MRSLRTQLLAGTALGMVAVLLVSGVALYALVGRALREEFDDSLAARARSLSALVEQEHGELEFELAERSLPEFEPSDHAEYYQLWLADGTVHTRSASLQGQDLICVLGEPDVAAFKTVVLPDGRPGRVVGITFQPRREYPGESVHQPMRVTLVLARDLLGLRETLAEVRGILLGICLVALVLSAAVLAWVVRRGLSPIDDLCVQIADVGDGDLSARIQPGGAPAELTPVVERLNELLVRIEAAFQRERRFTGDVAHELRTPLAGLRSKMELALSRERDPCAYRKSLADCLTINHEMQRIVDNLLHLARADAGQMEVRCEPVDLARVLDDCWELSEKKAAERNLRVDWCLDGVGLLDTDVDKLRLVMQNIFDNAVAYADSESPIRIAATDRDGVLTLAVSNSASQLTAEDAAHVFDRFWRRDSSFGAAEAHCGLGLALCKAIIEQLGGTIQAAVSAESTFTVTVCMPRRRQSLE